MKKSRGRRARNTRIEKGTLDDKHSEKMLQLERSYKSLPAKNKKLKRMEHELATLLDTNPATYTPEDIYRKAALMDDIRDIKREILRIDSGADFLDYINDTNQILIDYYDNDKVVDDVNEMTSANSRIGNGAGIWSYLPKGNRQPAKTNQEVISRAGLYNKYMNATSARGRSENQRPRNVCSDPECKGEIIICCREAYATCIECGLSERILVSSDKPNYREQSQDTGAYKRINHLTEILSQLQARESTDIPQSIIDAIVGELKKRGLPRSSLDIFRLRKILKNLGVRKYYEHATHIIQIINGKEPPNFSRESEQKIRKMFRDIQEPFSKHCPKTRKNFLNYSYVLHKFCQLLELDQYLDYFPLLKNSNKLLQHDRIWKKICEDMRWEYYKSI